jgi:kynurenine formamidase
MKIKAFTQAILLIACAVKQNKSPQLDLLPPKSIYIVALPMKIGNGSGAPLRIIANVLNS